MTERIKWKLMLIILNWLPQKWSQLINEYLRVRRLNQKLKKCLADLRLVEISSDQIILESGHISPESESFVAKLFTQELIYKPTCQDDSIFANLFFGKPTLSFSPQEKIRLTFKVVSTKGLKAIQVRCHNNPSFLFIIKL